MSASDFRQIAAGAESGKAERLFRAAVSAFCSLTRPSRREIAQLEDLTLPLFENVSVESRRYVAAALSECEYAPAALVRRLCQERVDIAAPLLIRSRALSDVDLIALIGRHGLPHARAIARRKDLNQTIADLIKVLERPTLVRSQQQPETTAKAASENAEVVAGEVNRQEASDAAETVRRRLRSMMRESCTAIGPFVAPQTYVKLRETALTGNAAFFQTALADALEVDFSTARTLTASHNYTPLLAALRALDLSEDKAFLITAAIYPTEFPHPQAIRIFLDRYRLLHRDAALDRLRGWKADTVSKIVRKPGRVAANADLRKPNSADIAATPKARRV
ncbi:DUF2336 domain-containing protein [Mesorhizobium sp. M0019]|uniref:DUF2336 domain-containing protein n=1 Tax=unclassified Mesorhizobium TaxID=325217 RepID=UPI003337EBD6